MKNIANLLFEAKMLKEIPRSGYHFLGSGKESVAEHSFVITFIAFVMAKMEPDVDTVKLISMCLIHDLPESRTGDMNYVQKKYVDVDEMKAVDDLTREIPFGDSIRELIVEFNACITREARLARDADQISFILELKTLADTGRKGPETWLPIVMDRLQTETGKQIAESIADTNWDEWWKKNYVD
ncbi:MAG: HD domain-containing protein [Proteobacteria bacterium]|nr:HD domain-containing protein [Pseudomonadota bacterium]